MSKRKLLIATGNPGKIVEIKLALETLPFDFCTLKDFPDITPPDEPYDEIELNAAVKAKYYAGKTGLLSLADDSGIFVEALGGWPGVKSPRVGKTDDERMNAVLERLRGVKKNKRVAFFRASLALFDPLVKTIHIVTRDEPGMILEEAVKQRRAGFGYDPIFWVPEIGLAYAEISIEEKNKISHRAKALNEMDYIIKKQYGARNIVVPCALIIQNGRLLMQKRNDPFRPDYHGKWEFPGG